jgi:pyruvate/2-oxoglutarate dehydrogenase complex dihydrolipoamide acyltransferase (E2) component
MAYIATIALIVTAVSAVAGGTIAAVNAKKAGDAQEDAAKANAQIAQNNASAEAAAAAENVKRRRESNQRQMSGIRARMAGGGTNIGTGSSLEVLGTSASELELQTLDMFRDSEAKQVQYQNGAAVDLWSGKQAAAAGRLNAAGSLIESVGRAAGSASPAKSSGVIATGTR